MAASNIAERSPEEARAHYDRYVALQPERLAELWTQLHADGVDPLVLDGSLASLVPVWNWVLDWFARGETAGEIDDVAERLASYAAACYLRSIPDSGWWLYENRPVVRLPDRVIDVAGPAHAALHALATGDPASRRPECLADAYSREYEANGEPEALRRYEALPAWSTADEADEPAEAPEPEAADEHDALLPAPSPGAPPTAWELRLRPRAPEGELTVPRAAAVVALGDGFTARLSDLGGVADVDLPLGIVSWRTPRWEVTLGLEEVDGDVRLGETGGLFHTPRDTGGRPQAEARAFAEALADVAEAFDASVHLDDGAARDRAALVEELAAQEPGDDGRALACALVPDGSGEAPAEHAGVEALLRDAPLRELAPYGGRVVFEPGAEAVHWQSARWQVRFRVDAAEPWAVHGFTILHERPDEGRELPGHAETEARILAGLLADVAEARGLSLEADQLGALSRTALAAELVAWERGDSR